MKRLILTIILSLGLGASLALAQTPTVTQTYPLVISPNAASITSSSAFQSVFPASTQTTGRVDCLIQNKSSNSMYLYFGPATSATSPNSVTLAAGGIFRCANSGVVIRNQISIGGTSGDRFFFAQ